MRGHKVFNCSEEIILTKLRCTVSSGAVGQDHTMSPIYRPTYRGVCKMYYLKLCNTLQPTGIIKNK